MLWLPCITNSASESCMNLFLNLNLFPSLFSGCSHGNKEVFSCRGIQLAVDWFKERGHKDIKVFVPLWRKEAPRFDSPITGRQGVPRTIWNILQINLFYSNTVPLSCHVKGRHWGLEESDAILSWRESSTMEADSKAHISGCFSDESVAVYMLLLSV